MKGKKIIIISLMTLSCICIYPLKSNAAGWDVSGYKKFGNYEFEYTDKYYNGILTNNVNKNVPPFDVKGNVQQLTFLPGAKNYRDYVYISQDGGETFQPIGNPDKINTVKGEYQYSKNINVGTIIKIKNISFVSGYSLDAKITIKLKGVITLKTDPKENFFNFDVNYDSGGNINEPTECLYLEVVNSRTDEAIPVQDNKYYLLSYKDNYYKGYQAGFREALTVSSEGIKYYQNNVDNFNSTDMSLLSSNNTYSVSNYISNYNGTIEYLKYTYVERELFFEIGRPLVYYSNKVSGFSLRTISFFYNTPSNIIPKPYETATLEANTTIDGKYNGEFTVKQFLPIQSNAAYYPENGLELVPNLENNDVKHLYLDSITTESGKKLDVNDYIYNAETLIIQFPVETLKKLASETLIIKYKTDLDYETDKGVITEFFNTETHTFDIPFSINAKIKFANEFENKLEETLKIEYPLDMTVKTKELEVNAGEVSGDYSIEDYIDLSTLKLNYPNKDIKIKSSVDPNISFDTPGTTEVPIQLICEELNLTKIIKMNVVVKSEPKSYSDKAELTYKTIDGQIEYQITQQLPKQFDNSYFPESLEYEIANSNTDYLEFMDFIKPSLIILGSEISPTLYNYDSVKGKLSLSKELLKKYQNEEVSIIFTSHINQENKKNLDFIKDSSTNEKLDLDTSITMKITAVESPLTKKDSQTLDRETTLSYPLDFSIESKKLAVLVGQKVDDYLLEDYIDKESATTGSKLLDKMLSISLLTPGNTIFTIDMKKISLLMSVDLGNGNILKKEIVIDILPIEKQKYLVSMGEQFNKTDTNNAHFYSYLNISEQKNDIALPEQLTIELNITKEQAAIMKPQIQKVEGIPVGSYSISKDRRQLLITKENLKKYSGKEVRISWKTNMNYRVPEAINYFYDNKSHTFKMYDTNVSCTSSYLISGNEVTTSEKNKTYDIAYNFNLRAEVLSPSYPSGTSTADGLDINKFVKNIQIDYYETGFKRDFIASFPKEPIIFEGVGTTKKVPITIVSEKLGLKLIVDVPVLVTEELKLGFDSVPSILTIPQLTTENGENDTNRKLYHLKSIDDLIVKDTRKVKSWRLSMISSEIKGLSTDNLTRDKVLMGQFINRKDKKIFL